MRSGMQRKTDSHFVKFSATTNYFIYEETDFDGNNNAVINAISVRLLTDAKRKKPKSAANS